MGKGLDAATGSAKVKGLGDRLKAMIRKQPQPTQKASSDLTAQLHADRMAAQKFAEIDAQEQLSIAAKSMGLHRTAAAIDKNIAEMENPSRQQLAQKVRPRESSSR